jgi:glycolate oxidase FAD binding subunit
MARIVDHAAADLTVVVEAGASLSEVNRALRCAGQWLPFDPPFPQRTSVGGLVAAQACGPSRQAFGTPRESLIGARAVLADGTVVTSGGRVVKNVAGYDLHRLLAGSYGSLAVIVEANFKCRPLPEAQGAVECRGRRAPLFELALRVAASSLAPSFLEWFGGGEDDVLVAGFAGVPEQVAWSTGRFLDMVGASGGLAAAGELPPEIVARRIEGIVAPAGGDSDPFLVRAGLPPRHLPGWVDEAMRLWEGAGARVIAHAHAGVGVARLRVEDGRTDAVQRSFGLLRRAARERGGYLVVESQPAGWCLEPWGLAGPSVRLMQAVKRAFDPLQLLKGA